MPPRGFIALSVTLLSDLTRSFPRPRLKPYGFSCPGLANKVGDPNGIRTRVTPVKGECPRPLDDRVVSGREENALSRHNFKQSYE